MLTISPSLDISIALMPFQSALVMFPVPIMQLLYERGVQTTIDFSSPRIATRLGCLILRPQHVRCIDERRLTGLTDLTCLHKLVRFSQKHKGKPML
jgi:hypothetical protein